LLLLMMLMMTLVVAITKRFVALSLSQRFAFISQRNF